MKVFLATGVVWLLAAALAPAAYGQCKWPSVTSISMTADVGVGSLGNDGRGTYIDRVNNVEANLEQAARLLTSATLPVQRKARFLVFNLSSPVLGAGSIALGAIQDPQAELHALYKLDPVGDDGLQQMHSVQEIPGGATVQSQRTEMLVHLNGVPYLLIFGGDWPKNTCGPTQGAIIVNSGTTAAWIKRTGSVWTVYSEPTGSIGRLWNYQDPFNPIDAGLYNFSFWVQLTTKAKK